MQPLAKETGKVKGNWLPAFRSKPNWQKNSAGSVRNTAGPICTAWTSTSAMGSLARRASSNTISLANVHSVAPTALGSCLTISMERLTRSGLGGRRLILSTVELAATGVVKPGSIVSKTLTASAPTRPPTKAAERSAGRLA